MKLVFYSGGDAEENELLDIACLKLIDHTDPVLTFIPSDSIDGEHEFRYFVERFQKFGIKRFLYFPIDVPQDRVFYNEALTSQMIFLGGGNTYYFTKYLRSSGLFKRLKVFVDQGGVLAGESAGAIVMTPTLKAASYPSFDCDDNEEKMTNLRAMSFVSFEFFPHYRNSERYEKELLKQSRKVSYPIYACADGAGVIRKKQEITFLGKSWCFYQGKKVNLAGRSDKKVVSK
jgi:dipeptidase E